MYAERGRFANMHVRAFEINSNVGDEALMG